MMSRRSSAPASPATHRARAAAPLLAALALAAAGPAAASNLDAYPTADRVVFVQECMRQHPGNYFEMVNKCSCALDAIAREVPYDQFETLSTVANALTIGGERGSALRDYEAAPPMARKLRDLILKAKRGCFIKVD